MYDQWRKIDTVFAATLLLLVVINILWFALAITHRSPFSSSDAQPLNGTDTISPSSPALVSTFKGAVRAVTSDSITMEDSGGIHTVVVPPGSPVVREGVAIPAATSTSNGSAAAGPQETSISLTDIAIGEKVVIFTHRKDDGTFESVRLVVENTK